MPRWRGRSSRPVRRSTTTGAATVDDVDLADEFVEHVLDGEAAADADVVDAAGPAALDAATPAALSDASTRVADTVHPFVLVAAPESADGVPSAEQVLAIFDDGVTIAPPSSRPDGRQADALMDRPDPVTEQSTSTIQGDGDRISATVLHFANGLDVVLDHTGITDGEIAIDAVRDGGLSVLDDARVPAARMAPGVVAASGLGDLDAVAVSHVLSATGIDLTPAISEEMANIDGTTPTDDLETTMAYVHQLLVAARVDDAALRNQLDSAREAADAAPSDPDTAPHLALDQARFGDTPRDRSLLTEPSSITSPPLTC